ncbi:MAG: DEAD/DEAH box helicase [Deltaproteobacteria bacterium]|nr:DEAD/DEAH box helicase [Nannocystaceae bacterium]
MLHSDDQGHATATSTDCIPILRLVPETLLVDQGPGMKSDFREVKAAAIELSFDYRGARVRASEPGDRVWQDTRWIPRDLRAEADARRVLEGFGPIEIGALEDCALPPDSDVDYVVDPNGDTERLCSFNQTAVPRLRALGWNVEVDRTLQREVIDASRLVADLEVDERGWFELDLGVEIDGRRIDVLPVLLEMIASRASFTTSRRPALIPLDDRHHLAVPVDRLRALLDILSELYGMQGAPREGTLRVHPGDVGWTDRIDEALGDAAPSWRGGAFARGEPRVRAHERAPADSPRELRAELRPYQRIGLGFMQWLREREAGGVLADDMGLGKTLQTIAHIATEQASGRMRAPALVVTPTSLVGNWKRELKKFAPHLRVLVLTGPDRHRRRIELCDHHVVITSYPLLLRDRAEFGGTRFHMMVADEAQALKNPRSQVHQAVRSVDADHRVLLTGTPIENHTEELWALFDLAMPGLLGDATTFRAVYRLPIERDGNASRMASLRDRIAPYVLRRMKDEVATELPPKTEIVRALELHGPQRDLYEAIRIAGHAAVRKAVRERGIGGATIDILGALMKLRQVCCDPRLVRIGAAQSVGGSAKLEALLEMVERMRAEGRRMLVFSQFATMLGIIADELKQRGIRHTMLTGATADREAVIDTFQSGRADVFLISLKAGGTGLNLTDADTVIHYDPWWNPAAQNQATDRAHRIGQRKPVFVYKMIIAGSVEERMLALQQRKQSLADALLARTEAGDAGWSERDVDDLFAPLAEG